jgi:hypothetical protein
MVMPSKIQLRRGLAADWTSANPVLSQGEMGLELDTKLSKVGNGIANWTALPYFLPTKANLNLGNVDNTSDLDKPLSTAVQNYITDTQVLLSNKADIANLSNVAFSGTYIDLLNKPQLAGANWELFES